MVRWGNIYPRTNDSPNSLMSWSKRLDELADTLWRTVEFVKASFLIRFGAQRSSSRRFSLKKKEDAFAPSFLYFYIKPLMYAFISGSALQASW